MSITHLHGFSGTGRAALCDRNVSNDEGLTYTMSDVTCPACKSLLRTIVPPDETQKPESDPVSHPSHYTSHPSGIECIQVTEHMPFCIGSSIKYLWRAGLKGDAIEDLRKARWYIDREIQRLQSDD